MDYRTLPVYKEKERILDALAKNQVIIVQSPTGSGKTTQIPVILHEAGYDAGGIIAVTQPRRIATLSVSSFIARQLGTVYPGLVGYKMRFEDETNETTRIKIMTDGILLQEMKLDPMLTKYSVLMVDEAHERSLNIDFVLGLLKRILKTRPEFKVIVSSATLNTQVFSEYFDGAPIVTIDTVTFPVTTIYDPPMISASTMSAGARDELTKKIIDITGRVVSTDGDDGAILIFLPGERAIKDIWDALLKSDFAQRIYCLPLYGRLSKEDQERVFETPPQGKRKVIISTNIAETSVTIPDVTVVIDSGLSKLSYYDTKTFATSLVETKVSRASVDQRRGRAGRVRAGTCYRLFSRKDYEKRELFTKEEIFRTDLSDVVLQMADLGIRDFDGFDFISMPSHKGIMGAVKTLRMLDALAANNELTNVGRLMTRFPVEPRISRIITEAIMAYPQVTEEAVIVSSFLSASSPFVLPAGQELQAREAHHTFNDDNGDFVSYLKLFAQFTAFFNEYGSYSQMQLDDFCSRYFLDCRVMLEIKNIKEQLCAIVTQMNIPILKGGAILDMLTCVAKGMVQFVAVKSGRDTYRTLTQDKISIHPGSCMCKKSPPYIVAGEIIETSRIFASSVSPITRQVIERVAPDFVDYFHPIADTERKVQNFDRDRVITSRAPSLRGWQGSSKQSGDTSVVIAGKTFPITKRNGAKFVVFGVQSLVALAKTYEAKDVESFNLSSKIKARIEYPGGFTLLDGEALSAVLYIAKKIDLQTLTNVKTIQNVRIMLDGEGSSHTLAAMIGRVLSVVTTKRKNKAYGFLTLYTDDGTIFWTKGTSNFYAALKESLSTLETLADKQTIFTPEEQVAINDKYALMSELLET